MKNFVKILWGVVIITLSTISLAFAYTQEQIEAYQWAYKNGITTQPTIEQAKLNSNLTRQAFAKMVVNYLENVVWMKQSTSNSCSFLDENKITNDLKPFVRKTCAYGIMWSDWKNFNPTQFVDRGQLWTVLSRIIWGDRYNVDGKWYYIYHLNALKDYGIMNKIDNPKVYAKRWDVMIMLKRIYEKSDLDVDNWSQISVSTEGLLLTKDLEVDEDWNVITCLGKNGKKNGKRASYYPNWQVELEGTCKNGQETGKRTYYYENWQIAFEGNMKKTNVEDWKWTYYYESWKKLAEGSFENGIQNGKRTSYYENGKVEYEWSYKNGKKDGKWITYYENGKIEYEENYKNGNFDWEQIHYYQDGSIKNKWNYKDGKLVEEWDKEDIKDWKTTYYYENWNIQAVGNMKNGKQDGKRTLYYENWSIEFELNYKNGVANWKAVSYFKNWKIESEWNMKNDYYDWKRTFYYESWNIAVEWNYKDWKETWKRTYYKENGEIEWEQRY